MTGNINSTIDELRSLGFAVEAERVNIHIEDAAHVLMRGINWYLQRQNKPFVPVLFSDADGNSRNPYREVAEWLEDNQGKGLLLYGKCGLGKTMLAYYVIPSILYYYNNPHKIPHCYVATDLNDPEKLSDILSHHIIVIDDIGTEEQMISYGQRRNPFDEVMDSVEKQGKLLIVTTNLSGEDIERRYGSRTFDRIKSTLRRVRFELTDADGNHISLRSND